MKKSLISSSLLVLTLLLQVSCSQEDPKKVASSRDMARKESDARSGRMSSSARTANSCGTWHSGTNYGSVYYTYPDKTFDLSTVANGRAIRISLDAVDVPNRFTLYDGNGNFLQSTGWLGNSTVSGPWGMSLNTSSTATFNFNKSTATYKLRVETCPNNGISDYWSAYVGCL
jgi:hypothetical protein